MAETTQTDLVQLGTTPRSPRRRSQDVVRDNVSNELFFAVVGHVGSGTSEVALKLKSVLESEAAGPAFDVEILKARDQLSSWSAAHAPPPHSPRTPMDGAEHLQDLGDKMRKQDGDFAAVARALIREIRARRTQKLGGDDLAANAIVQPDQQNRAYILDSIRHPAEVQLLSNIYHDAFVLVGVVCDEDVREQRLAGVKFRDAGIDRVRKFMGRDAKDKPKFGQRVSDAFHLAHYFLDNTEDREQDGKPNPEWKLVEQLTRLKKILTHHDVVRPDSAETAMFAAQGAQLRSACLSRQVGASVVDLKGNVVALGTNEVPRAGGGVYGSYGTHEAGSSPLAQDERCVYRTDKYCSNTKEQGRITHEVLDSLVESGAVNDDADARDKALAVLKSSPIASLLEFSRAVHAEMDALLSLARRGLPAVGTRVFVTTFPCHYCARHLVAAGVDEVQYIEPYPKSKALELHRDSIAVRSAAWSPPSQGGRKVLFRPFVGVAPRLYSRVFTKFRDLKNAQGEYHAAAPEWTEPTQLGRLSYLELEARLAGSES